MAGKSWWPWRGRKFTRDGLQEARGADAATPQLQVGQVWRYRTRPGEEHSRARVLVLEDQHALGEVVHIRVDGVLVTNPVDPERPNTVLGHIPVTRSAFCRSLIDTTHTDTTGTTPTEADLEGYRHWRDAGGGVFALPMDQTIDAVEATLTGGTYTVWIDDNVRLALDAAASSADFEVGLDRPTLAWFEGFLERGRNEPGFEAERLVPVLGSLLGQCLVEHGSGTWREDADGWFVRLPGVDARPFDKVDKQARHGRAGGESIVSFYDLVLQLSAEYEAHTGTDGRGWPTPDDPS